MKKLEIQIFNNPPRGKVKLPGSKSITNRALMLAALADGNTIIRNPIVSDDSEFFIKALQKLGFNVNTEIDNRIFVEGLLGKIPSNHADLYIGNAGTAARFLSGLVCLGNGKFRLDGNDRMRERPIGDLVESLRSLGGKVIATENKGNICPPIEIQADGLKGGRTLISGKISSQFLSALLMIGPYTDLGLEIQVFDELNSRPYVEMTSKMMEKFGIYPQNNRDLNYKVEKGHYISPGEFLVEPDATAASYFLALPAFTGGSVSITGLHRNSIQGDIRFIEILKTIGLRIEESEDGITSSFDQTDRLRGVSADLSDMPDTAQTLAVMAPFAIEPVEIRGIASARVKESDRIGATCTELRKLGVQVDEFSDGMKIYPCAKINPAEICTYGDHRMAMSFALIGTRIGGIVIEDPDCVNKTFPKFFETLDGLR